MQKPAIPKGTRDFNPLVTARRNYIFDTIRQVFRLYGFQPIETPAMENLSTLMGKYGEEGDKLLFKVLNSGDFLQGIDRPSLAEAEAPKLATRISEKGLRYDLTVPFARYVVMYRNDITFPFRRYQIQPVWRADRPQKGRYREFYQCDADMIGSDSLINEAELLLMTRDVFSRLGIGVVVKLNNRKILAGIAAHIGHPDKLTDITVAIDKLDKIGRDNVEKELTERGLSPADIAALSPVFDLQGSNEEKITGLRSLLAKSEMGQKGLDELETVLRLVAEAGLDTPVEFDLTLARGLNYYTGAIIEVKAAEVAIGSISGGGRYDNLTGIFGLDGVSGVGISFGADRIYDVLEQSDLFPANLGTQTTVLLTNFDEAGQQVAFTLLQQLRKAGISAEMYPDTTKLKKQMTYANANRIPYVVLIGEEEVQSGLLTLKEMESGKQEKMKDLELIAKLSEVKEL
ncbi:MAG: histidine--tRNA ligase [Bacteroidales bacterium]|nr:histidine--tRNA ligase [Bacteroidales bacterium]MDD3663847.1 histidine--tRNA ligase [Bacteroidales bacterium]